MKLLTLTLLLAVSAACHMVHSDLAADLEEATPFVVKGLTIIYQTHKRVFPYGYPAAFVPNLHHQYIVILRNEK